MKKITLLFCLFLTLTLNAEDGGYIEKIKATILPVKVIDSSYNPTNGVHYIYFWIKDENGVDVNAFTIIENQKGGWLWFLGGRIPGTALQDAAKLSSLLEYAKTKKKMIEFTGHSEGADFYVERIPSPPGGFSPMGFAKR